MTRRNGEREVPVREIVMPHFGEFSDGKSVTVKRNKLLGHLPRLFCGGGVIHSDRPGFFVDPFLTHSRHLDPRKGSVPLPTSDRVE